jgi:hypothetical protein
MDKQTFKITTVRASVVSDTTDGLDVEHFTIRAYNLKDATKFTVDFIGADYQSITVEVVS